MTCAAALTLDWAADANADASVAQKGLLAFGVPAARSHIILRSRQILYGILALEESGRKQSPLNMPSALSNQIPGNIQGVHSRAYLGRKLLPELRPDLWPAVGWLRWPRQLQQLLHFLIGRPARLLALLLAELHLTASCLGLSNLFAYILRQSCQLNASDSRWQHSSELHLTALTSLEPKYVEIDCQECKVTCQGRRSQWGGSRWRLRTERQSQRRRRRRSEGDQDGSRGARQRGIRPLPGGPPN